MIERSPMPGWTAVDGSLFNMHELRAGVFRARAFDDGHWRIDCVVSVHSHTVQSCSSTSADRSLLDAQLEAEDVLRNLVADAARVFGGSP